MSIDPAIISQSVISLAIFGGLGAIFKFVADIRKELRITNGRLVAIEIWSVEHAKLDDVRNENLRQAIEHIYQKGE